MVLLIFCYTLIHITFHTKKLLYFSRDFQNRLFYFKTLLSLQLQESKKPSIAQTLARLFIKLKQYDKAEEWATKALELKELFTFFDTRGQGHKVKLKKTFQLFFFTIVFFLY